MNRQSDDDTNERRIIIVGKTGSGKSSTANTILGQPCFTANRSLNPITNECCVGKHFRKDTLKDYIVVDTPGLLDTKKTFAETAILIQESLKLCSAPHVFLLVVKSSDRFTQEDLLTIAMMRIIFGEEFLKYTIVVFTRGNEFSTGDDFNTFWRDSESALKWIEECGNRVTRIENTCASDPMNATLLEMIEELSCHGTKFYNYDSIKIHKDILQAHLKDHPGNVDLPTEIKQLSDLFSTKLGRDKWKNRLIGGAVVVGVGAGGAALWMAPFAVAVAPDAPALSATAAAVGGALAAAGQAAVPYVGGALSVAASAAARAGSFAMKFLTR